MEDFLKSSGQSSNPLPPPPTFGGNDDLYSSPPYEGYNNNPAYPAYPADDLYGPQSSGLFPPQPTSTIMPPPPISSSQTIMPPPPISSSQSSLPPPPTMMSTTPNVASAPYYDTDELGGAGMLPPPPMSGSEASGAPAMNPNFIDASVESLGTIISNQNLYARQQQSQSQYVAPPQPTDVFPPSSTPPYPEPQQSQYPQPEFQQPPQPEFQQPPQPEQAQQNLLLQQQQQPFYSSSNLPRPTPQTSHSVLEAEILTGIDPPNPDVAPLFTKRNQKQQADFSKAQTSTRNIRPTTQCIPNSPNVLNQWVLPFGAICQPLAEHEHEPPVAKYIVRCNECRAYINPFVLFLDNGNRWKCNMCNCVNATPQGYYQSLDEFGMRTDITKVTGLRIFFNFPKNLILTLFFLQN